MKKFALLAMLLGTPFVTFTTGCEPAPTEEMEDAADDAADATEDAVEDAGDAAEEATE
ncbi:Hypothetical protein PBC10988_11180 [Planctomycetales bacterium 10988]|nr:Hypothetical protein PBC10988_11180 [Planctomycetales bacterium 10988]